DVSGTVQQHEVTVTESSTAPSSISALDSICNGETVTLTAVGGVLGTDAVYQWSDDAGFNNLISNGADSSYITVSPSATTTYYVRISSTSTACSNISDSVRSKTVVIYTPSNVPTTLTSSNYAPCYGEEITLTQVNGSLNSHLAYFEWATDEQFTNVIDTTHSNSLNVTITEPTTYYVRLVDSCTGTSQPVSTNVSWVQASDVIYGDDIVPTTTHASICTVDDYNWHYFVDATGRVLGAINSHGQNLGGVKFTVTKQTFSKFINPNNTCELGGEWFVWRTFTVTPEINPDTTNTIGFKLFITKDEYLDHKTRTDNETGMYPACFGETNDASDLQVSGFFLNESGDTASMASYVRNIYKGVSPVLRDNNEDVYEYQYEMVLYSSDKSRFNHARRADYADSTTFYLHNSTGRGAILPVELTTFTAEPVNEGVLVSWATASEHNNDRFEVLRSTDGVNFSVVGIVSGNGSTNTPHQYNFLDTDVSTGIYYYQLNQIDYDATETKSRIVSVEIKGEQVLNIGLFYPNPTQNLSSVIVTSPKVDKMTFTLLSIDGKQVFTKVYPLAIGENKIDVNLNSVPAGSYIGFFQTQGQTYNRKLVVQE
ncbi:MAG: T9SS type A sorting domain-containing protein, partial [Chitinophagales bacterium]|nr:T9SS type A sorting domain-containing protein [Chitinophagales bacterium]